MTTATETAETAETADKEEKAEKSTPKPKDYSTYLGKTRTDAQNHFASWVVEKTGLNGDDAQKLYEGDCLKAFMDGVRLGKALVMDHQASPENQEAQDERRAKRVEAAKQKAQEQADKKAKKQQEKAEEEKAKSEGKPVVKKQTAKAKAAETKATDEAPF